ncbi:hypothetical protein [Paenibacillus sp. YPG26]|uniref:hypothetical protein n=1 Tax=Paenibacillus sp. YPG26 TaxID=2878915 RepID=UPI00203BA3E3|nr:hypothetical protein [Paenibacillus sp. YPG26]USB34602.1 hypothetical protein LDO05_07535 [Paenibacillus sp. YPG26]
MMKIGKLFFTAFILVFSAVVVLGPQQASASGSVPKISKEDLELGSPVLIKKSETPQTIRLVGPDGKIEIKNAIVREYHPADPNGYLKSSGQQPLDPGDELVKVVDVTFIENEAKDQLNSEKVQPSRLGD